MIALYIGLSLLAGFAAGVYFSRPTRQELVTLRSAVVGLYAHVETIGKNVAKAV